MPNTYTQDNTAREGTQPAHTIAGSPYHGGMQRENHGPGTMPATAWSTAPYRKPGEEKAETSTPTGPRGCAGGEGSCGAPAMKATGYCYGHSRSLGLIEDKEAATHGDDR